jgi:ferredoxin-NADP reductase
VVLEVVPETPRVKTLRLDVPEWPGHLPGQHVDIRLTAEDGYQAQRSYSIASPPGSPLELTVELVDGGEVSPYLTEELREGDRFELRGPVGGYFVWELSRGGPLFLVAGGSGVVPFRAMLLQLGSEDGVQATLLHSSRGWDDVIYRDELRAIESNAVKVIHTLTRSQPDGWDGYDRRVDGEMLAEVGPGPDARPLVYVCGPTPFVESVANALVELGHDPAAVRTERFGPTGG